MTRTRITAAVSGLILTAAVLLSGCSSDSNTGTSSGAAVPEQSGGASKGDAATAGKVPAPKTGSGAGGVSDQPTVTRAIIKTGSLTVEKADVDAQRQKAIAIVAGLRGQVASEDTSSDADGRITQANLVLRVPTASYETAIQRFSDLGKRTAIHQESTDVTEAVVDVESRISTQRASLQRMRTLLAKANTIGEIVSVETELTRREADLEALLAKQKALAEQTELATLTLTLVEPGKAPVVQKDGGFVGGLKSGWHAFTATFSAIATALGAALPFLIVLALIGIPLWRLRRSRRPAATPAPDQS
jgi:hypothetical protein